MLPAHTVQSEWELHQPPSHNIPNAPCLISLDPVKTRRNLARKHLKELGALTLAATDTDAVAVIGIASFITVPRRLHISATRLDFRHNVRHARHGGQRRLCECEHSLQLLLLQRALQLPLRTHLKQRLRLPLRCALCNNACVSVTAAARGHRRCLGD